MFKKLLERLEFNSSYNLSVQHGRIENNRNFRKRPKVRTHLHKTWQSKACRARAGTTIEENVSAKNLACH